VIVPGFLTGRDEFIPLAESLTAKGIPTVVVPMPNWHWLPCLGGRSMRPMLERIDFTVRHLAGVAGNLAGKVALIGHSAGGWICRAYLSQRNYGGKAYQGQELVHSLITLGSPHSNAPGAAFKGVEWVNREPLEGVRALAVGGTGYKGDSSGQLTQNAYSFCCPDGSDGKSYDGDGVTPIQSALAMKDHSPNTDTLVLDDVETVAPELSAFHREGRPWYGDEEVIEKWAGWL
ncbi:hypothetical protein THAPSDRAFT_262296, partial [Thalassiosira pseudonana CCMP1335]